jgi:hypothetical protein
MTKEQWTWMLASVAMMAAAAATMRLSTAAENVAALLQPAAGQ